MMLPGYCTDCHRVKNRVRVTSHGLATMAARGNNVPTGQCVDCQQKEQDVALGGAIDRVFIAQLRAWIYRWTPNRGEPQFFETRREAEAVRFQNRRRVP